MSRSSSVDRCVNRPRTIWMRSGCLTSGFMSSGCNVPSLQVLLRSAVGALAMTVSSLTPIGAIAQPAVQPPISPPISSPTAGSPTGSANCPPISGDAKKPAVDGADAKTVVPIERSAILPSAGNHAQSAAPTVQQDGKPLRAATDCPMTPGNPNALNPGAAAADMPDVSKPSAVQPSR